MFIVLQMLNYYIISFYKASMILKKKGVTIDTCQLAVKVISIVTKYQKLRTDKFIVHRMEVNGLALSGYSQCLYMYSFSCIHHN